MSGHTPGPWTCGESALSRHGNLWLIVIEPQPGVRVPVAETFQKANARLIAAAPELLQACKNVRRFIQAAAEASHFLEGFGPKRTTSEDLELTDLDAAIAKAEGVEVTR